MTSLAHLQQKERSYLSTSSSFVFSDRSCSGKAGLDFVGTDLGLLPEILPKHFNGNKLPTVIKIKVPLHPEQVFVHEPLDIFVCWRFFFSGFLFYIRFIQV